MQLLLAETWLPVVGYEGHYDVSDNGSVRTRKWNTKKSGYHVVCQRITRRGYYSVMLSKNGVRKRWNVHRLVTAAFLGMCPNGKEVCHGDGNRLNNTVSNLRYGTRAENMADAIRHGTVVGKFANSISDETVCEIFRSHGTMASIARRFGVHHTFPGKVKRGECRASVTAHLRNQRMEVV